LISRVKEGSLHVHKKEEEEKPDQNKSVSTSASEVKLQALQKVSLNNTALSKSSVSFFRDSAVKGVHSGFGVFGTKS